MRSLTWDEVRALRVARSFLARRAPAGSLVEVAAAVGGIQAQVMSAAELALAARADGATQRDVQAELWERRGLVKTWTLRGTLHLHPAEELPLWTASRRTTRWWREAEWCAQYGIDAAAGERLLATIAEALDGRCLLREEIASEVGGRVGPWARERLASGWGYLLGEAAVAGVLCHGPPRGTKVTFVRADQWCPDWREIDPEDALAETVRRYLAAYGPATPGAFGEWFGTDREHAGTAFASLGDELVEVEVEGRRAWLLASDAAEADEAAPVVRLLPQYDCLVMAFREREHFVVDAARAQVRAHPRGRYEGPAGVAWLLVDGWLAGLWERRRRGRHLELSVAPATPLERSRHGELELEGARVGQFFGLEAELNVSYPEPSSPPPS